jgi:hypothetical protein
MKRLFDRLVALEKGRESRVTLLVITIQGGLHSEEPTFASANDLFGTGKLGSRGWPLHARRKRRDRR